MWQFYNPNPHGNRVIDCTVRALCKALDTDWDTAYCMIAAVRIVTVALTMTAVMPVAAAETHDVTAWDAMPVMTAIPAPEIWSKNCAA